MLEFLENITHTEPVEDSIKWDDDEPAVGGVVASFGPAYGHTPFGTQPLDPEVEDLHESVVSYPGEDKNVHGGKKTPVARRSVSVRLLWGADQSLTLLQRHDSLGPDKPNRNSGLENFGSQGWPPGASPVVPARALSRQSRQGGATPRANMRSGSRLANGMRPPSISQSDMPNANIAISVRAPSVMLDRPPSLVQSLAPTDLDMRYALDHPDPTPPVTSPAQSARSRAELLPSRKTHSFYHDHVGGGSAPNSPGPVQHSRNPASYQAYGTGLRSRVGSPLKQDMQLASPSIHAPSVREPQTPRAQPIRSTSPPRQAITQAPPSPRRPPTTAPAPRPLSASIKPPSPPKYNQVIPAPPPPPAPVVRQFQTPAHQRTQYGPQKPPELISTLRLRKVDPAHLPPDWPMHREEIQDEPSAHQGVSPHGTPRANQTKAMSVRSGNEDHVRTVAAQRDARDEHVQSHVHELTELDNVIVHQAEPAGHYDDWHTADQQADIANHMQEVYEIVDADEPFVPPPEEMGTIHGASEEGDSTPKAANVEPLPMDIEIHPPSERSPPRAGTSLYMVDENQLDRVEDMPERELVEMLKTPHTGYTNLQNDGESVVQGLNPTTLEMLGKHHDEDLCILLQAVDDDLQHPVVRKAVRRAISSRLRRLGMGDDYDVSRFNPGMSTVVLTEVLSRPSSAIPSSMLSSINTRMEPASVDMSSLKMLQNGPGPWMPMFAS